MELAGAFHGLDGFAGKLPVDCIEFFELFVLCLNFSRAVNHLLFKLITVLLQDFVRPVCGRLYLLMWKSGR